MPEINGDINTWVSSNNVTSINPLPSPDPNQRGPSCGFYALGFVMAYWQAKDASLPAIQARTNNVTAPQQVKSPTERAAKLDEAQKGNFSSLRQYAKFNSLTAYGSVFSAENIVEVARGNGARYGGRYDGRVFHTTDIQDFIEKVKGLIASACPVIVPFDVGNSGDPELHTGKRAHWTVICGWRTHQVEDWFLHRHWGKYRESKASDFALSCQGLTSNALLEFEKTQVQDPKSGKVIKRDWMTADSIARWKNNGSVVQSLGKKGVNLEFTNPTAVNLLPQHIPDPNDNVLTQAARSFWNTVSSTPYDAPNISAELKKHGFQPHNVGNNGLRGRIVAVYPQGTALNV